MKKNFLFTIISLSVCITLCGQTISQSNNRYRGNDVLEKKQVKVQGFDLNSKKGVWSLGVAKWRRKMQGYGWQSYKLSI